MDLQVELTKIAEKVAGCKAGVLVGNDGMPVATYEAPNSEVDVFEMGAELSALLAPIEQLVRVMRLGALKNFQLQTERSTVLLVPVSSDYFVLLVLDPGSYPAQGIFYTRVHQDAIRADLS